MRAARPIYLVDTNVLVYAYDPSDRVKQARAIETLSQLAAVNVGALSAQVLGEFFVTVTRKIAQPLTAANAEHSMTNYARSWVVFEITSLATLEAARGVQRHGLSYWDSLIWATAKLNGAPFVLTEDIGSRKDVEGVRFLNPFVGELKLV